MYVISGDAFILILLWDANPFFFFFLFFYLIFLWKYKTFRYIHQVGISKYIFLFVKPINIIPILKSYLLRKWKIKSIKKKFLLPFVNLIQGILSKIFSGMIDFNLERYLKGEPMKGILICPPKINLFYLFILIIYLFY